MTKYFVPGESHVFIREDDEIFRQGKQADGESTDLKLDQNEKDEKSQSRTGETENPHDKFFRRYFSHPAVIYEFLEFCLDEKCLKVLNPLLENGELKRTSDSFVTADMNDYFSDIIFSLEYEPDEDRTTEAAFLQVRSIKVAFILEHKSYRDRDFIFQLMNYMRSYMEQEYRSRRELTPIIPILISQHSGNSVGLIDLKQEFSQLPEVLKRYQIIFDVIEVKFPSLTAEEISSHMVKLYHLAATLKNVSKPIERMQKIASELVELEKARGKDFMLGKLRELVEYILMVSDLSEKTIRDVINNHIVGGGDIVESTADKLRKEGRKKGRREGLEVGRQEGKEKQLQETLKTLLEKKFSHELSEDFFNLMEAAEREKLLDLRDEMFNIESLEEAKKILE